MADTEGHADLIRPAGDHHPADLPIAIGSVSRQVAEGDISPEEGSLVVGLLEAQRRAIEMNELAERVAELEKRLASRT